ncbi:hypothetical protein JYT29_00465 [Nitrospina gracilis]|nr:hypothetical protein [Nitrospina gracilis]
MGIDSSSPASRWLEHFFGGKVCDIAQNLIIALDTEMTLAGRNPTLILDPVPGVFFILAKFTLLDTIFSNF